MSFFYFLYYQVLLRLGIVVFKEFISYIISTTNILTCCKYMYKFRINHLFNKIFLLKYSFYH